MAVNTLFDVISYTLRRKDILFRSNDIDPTTHVILPECVQNPKVALNLILLGVTSTGKLLDVVTLISPWVPGNQGVFNAEYDL